MADESKKGEDGAPTDIYNVEAAEILANEAQLLPISEAVPIYEQLLTTFPTAKKKSNDGSDNSHFSSSPMALHVSSAGFLLRHRRGQLLTMRVVASENLTLLGGEHDKVKLGGFDVKVTKLSIGGWSWGDTNYWNDSQWDGEQTTRILKNPSPNHTQAVWTPWPPARDRSLH